jgi:superfamily II DNA or RNA helicase
MDEAHEAIAPSYRLVLDSFVMQHPSIGLLGLTATPGRTWSNVESDRELAEYFGLRKVGLHVEGYDSPVEYLIAEQYLARPVFRSLFYEGRIEITDADRTRIATEFDIPRVVLERLATHEQRNLVILSAIESLRREHKRILVFASSIQHSRLLASVLRVRGFDAYSVDGTTPGGERASILAKFKEAGDTPRVLCNFGVLTTGFDAPRTSAVVIARPTQSLVLYSQMIGRAIRGPKAGGNASAEVVTIVDTELPGFGSIVQAFHNWEDVWREDV